MRLEDIVLDLSKAINALGSAAVTLGYIGVATMAGFVSHIRAIERGRAEMSILGHVAAIIRRGTVASFVGLLVYFAMSGWGQAASPWGYLVAGLCSMYAGEALDLAWMVLKRRAHSVAGGAAHPVDHTLFDTMPPKKRD